MPQGRPRSVDQGAHLLVRHLSGRRGQRAVGVGVADQSDVETLGQRMLSGQVDTEAFCTPTSTTRSTPFSRSAAGSLVPPNVRFDAACGRSARRSKGELGHDLPPRASRDEAVIVVLHPHPSHPAARAASTTVAMVAMVGSTLSEPGFACTTPLHVDHEQCRPHASSMPVRPGRLQVRPANRHLPPPGGGRSHRYRARHALVPVWPATRFTVGPVRRWTRLQSGPHRRQQGHVSAR